MYCRKCGAPIDNSAVFCEKCGEQNKVQSTISKQSGGNVTVPTQPLKEEVIFSAEQAVEYIKFIGIKLGIVLILCGILIVAVITLQTKISITITDMKYENTENYYKSQQLSEQLDNMKPIFTSVIVGVVIVGGITLILSTSNMLAINKTSLCCTNVRVVGNTGELFGNTMLNASYSDISTVIVKHKKEYGWVNIETKWGAKYAFFIKNPDTFLYCFNEQIKIIR